MSLRRRNSIYDVVILVIQFTTLQFSLRRRNSVYEVAIHLRRRNSFTIL